MNVVCVKSDSMDDWYCIERAEHDGRMWMEPTEYGAKLMSSARICDADVEGTSEEMLAIAAAIRNGTSIHFKRCSALNTIDGYELHSPRNSQEAALLTLTEAHALADHITKTIAGI